MPVKLTEAFIHAAEGRVVNFHLVNVVVEWLQEGCGMAEVEAECTRAEEPLNLFGFATKVVPFWV
jgi:hypothetical protein